MGAEPDEGDAERQQRDAEAGSRESREHQQEFGVHAAQESHDATI